jgi:hypothetical protein
VGVGVGVAVAVGVAVDGKTAVGTAVLVGAGNAVAVTGAMLATGAGGELLQAVTAHNTTAMNPRWSSFMVISSPVILSDANAYPRAGCNDHARRA